MIMPLDDDILVNYYMMMIEGFEVKKTKMALVG